MKTQKLFSQQKKAFTLIELLIVLVILAILIAIALPRYNNSRQRAAIIAHNANVRVLESAAQTYLMNNDLKKEVKWPDDTSWKDYLEGQDNGKWYTVPMGVPQYEGQKYEVTINKDGTIKVEPGIIADDIPTSSSKDEEN